MAAGAALAPRALRRRRGRARRLRQSAPAGAAVCGAPTREASLSKGRRRRKPARRVAQAPRPPARAIRRVHCVERVNREGDVLRPGVGPRDGARRLGVLRRQSVERGEVRRARCGRAGRPGRDGGTVRRARGTSARCAGRRPPRYHARPRPGGGASCAGRRARAQPATRPGACAPGGDAASPSVPARQSDQGDAQHDVPRQCRQHVPKATDQADADETCPPPLPAGGSGAACWWRPHAERPV